MAFISNSGLNLFSGISSAISNGSIVLQGLGGAVKRSLQSSDPLSVANEFYKGVGARLEKFGVTPNSNRFFKKVDEWAGRLGVRQTAQVKPLDQDAICDLIDRQNLSQRLFDAIRDDEIYEAVEIIKSRKIDLNEREYWTGDTVLHRAAEMGRAGLLKMLIKKGVDVNAKNLKGQTALHRAVETGKMRSVEMLIEKRADLNVKNDAHETALQMAVDRGDKVGSDIAKMIIRSGRADLTLRSVSFDEISETTVLHRAAKDSNRELFDLTLEYIDPSQIAQEDTLNGYTTMHYAAIGGDTYIGRKLIEKGVPVDSKGGSKNTPLHLAATNGHEAFVQMLIDEGVEIDPLTYMGATPLHFAESKEVAIKLLDSGADVNAKNDMGETPLHWVARGGRDDLLHVLLEGGARVNEKDREGKTPLFRAVEKEKLGTVKKLIELAPDLDLNTKISYQQDWRDFLTVRKDVTVLHWAAENSTPEMIKALLVGGADPDIADKKFGLTPLHLAFLGRSQDGKAEALVEGGANLLLENKSGETPFWSVSSGRQLYYVDFMRGHALPLELYIERKKAMDKGYSEIAPYLVPEKAEGHLAAKA